MFRRCVSDPNGTRYPFGPGDVVVLPKGWYGRWDISQKIHKVWVVHEHPDLMGASTTPVVQHVSQLASVYPSEPRPNATWGSPTTASSMHYDVGPTAVGYWTCTPGGFVSNPKANTEAFFVLEGSFFLT